MTANTFDFVNGVAKQLIIVHTAAEPLNSEVKVQEIHEHIEVKAS